MGFEEKQKYILTVGNKCKLFESDLGIISTYIVKIKSLYNSNTLKSEF